MSIGTRRVGNLSLSFHHVYHSPHHTGARGPEPENEFVFEWRLSMFFNAALTELEVPSLFLYSVSFILCFFH
jgi:hypothetical protein